MVDNSKYFYISAIISFALFSFFILMFITMLFSSSKITTFALHKNNFVSISLDNIQTKKVKQIHAAKPIIKSPTKPVDIPSENIDVNDLFSDVWTKKITKKQEKPKDLKRIAQLQKQIPLAQKKIAKVREEEDVPASSNAEEVNEYLAKIQAIVYENFYVPSNTQGSTAKAVIEINSLGKLIDFRILTYSSNVTFNEEIDKIKERLLHVMFPLNTQHQSTKTVVILRAKE